ncbi:MAG: TonB-dependent hemoglobin/transferrin/lactoferrin family receptor [Gammaproteobacteria bacterium]|nr:TonB-dependent hemoglobin/transferrin/lactoferrin family receptor [Gammaproteobacteria bacterium]
MRRLALLSFAGLAAAAAAAPDEDRPRLSTSGHLLSEIVVSGTRLPESGHQGPVPVGVITRAEMDQRMTRNLADLLRDMPGVTTAGGPRQAAAKPNVRGLGEGRVVMRIDGARQNFQTRHRGQSFVDPLLLEQVEVLRGPASTLHGSGAIGGVVNVRTMDADSFLEEDERFGGRLTSAYEDNERGRFGAVTLAGRNERAGLLASVSRQKADDFKDGSGNRVDVTGHDGLSWLLKGHWDAAEATRVTLAHMDHEDDSRSFATADRPVGTLIDRVTRQRTTTLNLTHDPLDQDWLNADVTLYHSDLELDERAVEVANELVNRLQTLGLDAFNRSDFELASTRHRLVYGIEFYRDEQEGFENGVPRPQFANARQDTFGAFIQDRIELSDRFAMTLGVRHDRIRQQAERAGTEKISSDSTSLLAQGSYQLQPGLHAHLGYSEAFRAPNLRELYIGGQHFPGNNYLPNPDLKPETARNVELGLTHVRSDVMAEGDRLRSRVAIFRNDVDDFINQVVDGINNTTRFLNVAEARIEGVELSVDYEHSAWRARVFASRLRGDDRLAGLPLESIPGDEIGVVGARRWLGGQLETGTRVIYTAAQNRVPVGPHNAPQTPSHTLVDLFASWLPTPAWRLDLRVDNLTDTSYRRHLSLINDPGRSVRLQVSWRGGV